MWITKKEYEEHGNYIVIKKCPWNSDYGFIINLNFSNIFVKKF